MADAPQPRPTLRWSRLDNRRLLIPLILSLLVNIAVVGVYRWGVQRHWWEPVKLSATLPKVPPAQKPPPRKPEEEQIVFVDVSQEEKEPPKKAKYYSNKNAQAANPDTSKESNQPKIEGKQTVMPKTDTVQRPSKLAFSTPAPTALHGLAPKSPAPAERGDLDMAQKSDGKNSPQQPQQRPRTLKEAQQNLNPGEAMKQDGGVRRRLDAPSLDVKSTLTGQYDAQIIAAVTAKWYAMLDSGHFAQDRTGKVVVHFKLKYDGTILEMTTAENTVGISLAYVCREAIAEAAPFAAWTSDMRHAIDKNFREVSFTFYYY